MLTLTLTTWLCITLTHAVLYGRDYMQIYNTIVIHLLIIHSGYQEHAICNYGVVKFFNKRISPTIAKS